MDPHIFADLDPDPGSKNLADPTDPDPDPKHCYLYCRQIFDQFESESQLCRRFTVFVTKYNLMSKDNLIVPMMEQDAGAGESEA